MAEENISVNVNYFCEKHGKFARDQHFSVISYYLKRAALKEEIKGSNVFKYFILKIFILTKEELFLVDLEKSN